MSQYKNDEKEGMSSSKAKRVATIALASLAGVSVAAVSSAVLVYDSIFKRYERPDYKLYPGLYSYDRIRGGLERDTFKIKSGDNMLQAYYYESKHARGLAVMAHGIHAGADDYLPLIEAIVNRGYSVLAYDATGVYSSEGENMIGMCQSVCDMDNVLKFAESEKPFSYMPKVVFGHSWGGYASSSALCLHNEVKAAAFLAPMNDGFNVMVEKAEQYAGKMAYTAKPIFDNYQKLLFGKYIEYNAVRGINSTTAPILIAQGIDDTVITPSSQSITAHLDELTNPNVTVYWGKGSQGTHTGIWHSKESEEYQRVVESMLKLRKFQLGRDLDDSEKAEIYSNLDHRLYSDVNTELVDLMIKTFDKGIGL